MRRHAKASSAGSTQGNGKSRALFRDALTIRGASASFNGSGAPSGRRLGSLAITGIALIAGLAFGASVASAAPPTIGAVSAVSYASAHLTGTVDPGSKETFYAFETSTDGANWSEFWTNVEGPLAPNTGLANVSRDLSGLHGGTEYFVRLVTLNFSDNQEIFSAEPNPSFTTLSVAKPTVLSADDAASVSYTSAAVSGSVERPGGADPAFDAHCRFEYVSDDQFAASGFENAGQASCNIDPVTADEANPADPVTTPVSAELNRLSPSTTYHLRLVAENAGGTDFKEAAHTFATPAVDPPSVTIAPVTTFTGTTAHFSGTVNPNGSALAFDTSWHFQCSPECLNPSTESPYGGVVTADEGTQTVTADVTNLEPNIPYTVKLVASNAGGEESAGPEAFTTAAVAPDVSAVAAFTPEGGTKAILGGWVNPKNSATTYWIEYGLTSSYGQSIPASKDASAGSGGQAQLFTKEITGLTPNSTYHFRIVAENAIDKTEGADMNFVTVPAAAPPIQTCANDTLRSENNSTDLPDCRAYEQASPREKNGYDAGVAGPGGAVENVYTAAADGSAVSLESFGAFSNESKAATTVNPYVSRRGRDGWTTRALPPPQLPTNGDFPNAEYYSADLGHVGVRSAPGPSLAPGDTPGANNLYLQDTRTGVYRTLNVALPSGQAIPCQDCRIAGATPDLSHVVFEADHTAFEWVDGQTRQVSVLPDETPINGGIGTGHLEIGVTSPVISADGSRIVFTAIENGTAGQLYVRLNGDRTVLASVSQRTVPDPTLGFPIFVGATADLSKVFFIDGQALTNDVANASVSLYQYDVETNTVTNISASANPAIPNPADFDRTRIVGNSEDGSYVYFESTRQPLAHQAGIPGQTNIYLWHNGSLSLAVAGVTPGPTPDRRSPDYLSPNGRYLMFGDERQLSGYDNTDAASGAPDREYYLYDAVADRLTCVSCDPSGRRPEGTPSGGASFPNEPPRQHLYQPVGVSSDGSRAFFNSSDALVPEDVNGKLDAYMWEDGRTYLISSGHGGEASSYASASLDGNNVFFATREQLVPTDKDESIDVYDARVGGGFPNPPSPSLCEGESCHGPASSPSGSGSPGSESFSSATKPLSPSAQRLRRALKACKRQSKKAKSPKKARAKCQAKARKRVRKASNGRAH